MGSIDEIRLLNFITFSHVVFKPSSGLNVVVGPNGSGKSSLVCAICLGLGWSPRILGRERDVAEFIKRGESEAIVEVDLNIPEHSTYLHVKRVIKKRSSQYFVNKNLCTEKQVREVIKSFNIQLENLCMFLPQERIPEFSALSKETLLRETMLAVNPELFKYFRVLCNLQLQVENLELNIKKKEQLVDYLGQQVLKYREESRMASQRLSLGLSIIVAKAALLLVSWNQLTKRILDVVESLKDLRWKIFESVSATNACLEKRTAGYYGLLYALWFESLGAFRIVKEGFNETVNACLNPNYSRAAVCTQSIRKEQSLLHAKIIRLRRNIPTVQQLESQKTAVNETDIELSDLREKRRKVSVLEIEINDLRLAVNAKHSQMRRANDMQSSGRLQELRKISVQTCKSLERIELNRSRFVAEVFRPPALTCTVEPLEYASAVESLISVNSILTFTVLNLKDLDDLQNILFSNSNDDALTAVNIRYLSPGTRFVCDPEEASRLGFDGWASLFLHGPSVVKDMLCQEHRLHRIGVSKFAISENMVQNLKAANVSKWVSGGKVFQRSTRAEYGDSATSVRILPVQEARFLNKVEAALNDTLKEDVAALEGELAARESSLSILQQEVSLLEDKIKRIRQARVINRAGLSSGLSSGILKLREIRSLIASRSNLLVSWKSMVNTAHQNLLAELKRNTATRSNSGTKCYLFRNVLRNQLRSLAALSVANGGPELLTTPQRMASKVLFKIEQDKKLATMLLSKGTILQRVFASTSHLCSNPLMYGIRSFAGRFPKITIVSCLDLLQGRRSTMRKPTYSVDSRLKEIEKANRALLQALHNEGCRLHKIHENRLKIQCQWEAFLDANIARIGRSFSSHLRSLGCSGSLEIVKQGGVGSWYLELKVCFRQDGVLHVLDTQRQSGGERAITTICYFLALQPVATLPFRVVDEINQGMDEVNERWAHARMLGAVSEGPPSQLFLVTPKLLQELEYGVNITVHNIYTGEWMQANV
ncbi:P-loop containing nucleoside triphosphate hydrolase protein [Ascobolus immersus RN42]|uniref:Structural maintenance of chromosomes protein 5 n=1 Tax=Ascobolus immersus RN42 TaxID=1160509 RepID=A0A3N4IJP2_ASCIM|nr:P-loop containing nucleoside triphosphate hydrolase protein [Ascobolus immersus RN42]